MHNSRDTNEDVVSYVANQLSKEVINAMVDEKERSINSSQRSNASSRAEEER